MKHCFNPDCISRLRTEIVPEFRDEVSHCPYCATPLQAGPAPDPRRGAPSLDAWITVATFPNAHSAQLARTHLESIGVETVIVGENTPLSTASEWVWLEVHPAHGSGAFEFLEGGDTKALEQSCPELKIQGGGRHAMYCAQCGSPLSEVEITCPVCGGTPGRGRPANYPVDWPNGPAAVEPPVQTSELLAYTDESGETYGDGSLRDYYVPKWRPILEGRSSWAGFNWAAWFCGLIWCFWRRLYFTGLALFVAEFSASFLLVLVVLVGTGTQDPADPALAAAGWVGPIAVRFVFGALANRVYFRRTIKAIATIRTLEPDRNSRLALLRKKGGPSGWGLAFGLLFRVVI